jgi:beta-N-acetylhexosaminidase
MRDIKNMTLKEKLGQLLFVGFDGYEYNEHIRVLVEEYKVANVILFARNIKNIEQLSALNKSLHQEIMKHTKTMPLISIDQEGGLVTRIMSGATFCPGSMTIASTSLQNSQLVGELMGEELTRLGINMNLAPTLDVNNNPNNPVIGVRSYSDNPEMVSQFGLEFIKGLQSKGIIATAKHFPGHGDVEVDSHLGLPVVEHDKERLNQVELYPFKKVIGTVDAIMTAHIFFKAYESEQLPATLSKKVLTDLLRKELGFEGLIVSDCMEMKAIDDIYTTAKGVEMGIIAGLDMAFISHTFEKQIKALELIEKAIEDGKISIAEIDEKVNRILKYKEKTRVAIETNFLNNPNHLAYFEDKANKLVAQSIVDSSLTLVKGKRFLLSGKTLLLATIPFATTIAEDKLDTRNILEAVKNDIPEIDCMKLELNKIDLDILKVIDQYDTVFICSYNANAYKNQAKMINLISQKAKNLFVLSTRNPYDYLALDNVENYCTLYEYTPNSVKTIVKYLKGDIVPQGKLPIQLHKKFKVMASIYVGLPEYPYAENVKYLKVLKDKLVDTIFISAHMPEANEEATTELQNLLNLAQEMKIKVILDVSKKSIEKYGIPQNIYSLRLDWGFTVEDIIKLTKEPFLIELNASVIKPEEIDYLINKKVDLTKFRISHNFYPKPYTGLSQIDVLNKNKYYKSLGFTVMAYVPSKFGKRPPIYEGLPTVEEHRHMDLVAALADMNQLLIDEVCFGDAYASVEEIQTALEFNRDVLTVPILTYKGISETELNILTRGHYNRNDANPYFVRSSIREKNKIESFNTNVRNKKMITIDNENFLRYQGEVSIMKQNLEKDNRVNVVGVALISDFLLNNIKPGQKFKFVIRGEIDWKR